MPAMSFADSRAHIGVFNNAIHSGQDSTTNARQLQGLLGVSNRPSDLIPGTHASVPNDIYPSLSIEVSSDHREGLGSRAGTGGIGTAMSRHPWATGFVLATAALATVAFVATSTSDSLATVEQWPADVPQPLPLIMSGSDSSATSETVVGVCELAISKFPRSKGTQVICPSMEKLQSIESDAKSIVSRAQSMAQDGAVGSGELRRTAQCLAVRLRENKVEVLIAALRAEKSRLIEEAGGSSVDHSLRILATQMQVTEIDRKLFVLTATSRHLHEATMVINRRLLDSAG